MGCSVTFIEGRLLTHEILLPFTNLLSVNGKFRGVCGTNLTSSDQDLTVVMFWHAKLDWPSVEVGLMPYIVKLL